MIKKKASTNSTINYSIFTQFKKKLLISLPSNQTKKNYLDSSNSSRVLEPPLLLVQTYFHLLQISNGYTDETVLLEFFYSSIQTKM